MHQQGPQICNICFDEYTEKPRTVLQPCGHELCFECMRRSVLKNLQCPFCLQQVTSSQTYGDSDSQELQQCEVEEVEKTNDLETLEYLNHDFFKDDVEALKSIKEATETSMKMMGKLSDEKWFMFQELSYRVEDIEYVICEQEKMDPQSMLDEISILNSQLNALKIGNWNDESLNEVKQIYRESQQNQIEEDFQSRFFVQEQKQKKKKK